MKKPREKILDPQNTHEKKTETHETPTRKVSGPTKYPREKFSDPQRTLARWYQIQEIHNNTRPTEFSTLKKIGLQK